MKTIKFIPVAMALMALASCSSDDLGFLQNTFSGKTIEVTFANEDVTRGAVAEDASGATSFKFTKGDEFKLYGVTERLTNVYAFDETTDASGEFDKTTYQAKLKGGKDNITSGLAYALFPNKNENFFNSEYFEQFEMQLDAEYTYDNTLAAGQVYYCTFPMWGEANEDHTKVQFKFATAFVRFNLSGLSAASDAKLIITADKQLNGRFTANIEDNGGFPSLVAADVDVAKGLTTLKTAAELEADVTSALPLQTITVNLKDLKNNDAKVIYVAIPAAEYGYLGARLYYPNEERTDQVLSGKARTFVRGTFSKVTRAFSVTDQFYYPSDITQQLEESKEKSNDLNFQSDVTMTVTDGTGEKGEGGNTIILPAMATKNVTLNFVNATNAISGANVLNIVDAEGAAWEGTLTINTPDVPGDIFISAQKAKIVLTGGTKTAYNFIRISRIGALSFGDGKKETKQAASKQILTIAGANVNQGGVGAKITVEKEANANAIVMNNDGAKVDVKGKVGTLTLAKNSPEVQVLDGIVNSLKSTFEGSVDNKATGTVFSNGAADIKAADDGAIANLEFTSEWDGESAVAATDNKVYTAAQLANYTVANVTDGTTITIGADIDLKDNEWAGLTAAGAITLVGTNSHYDAAVNPTHTGAAGPYHTISNLNLSKALNAVATANVAEKEQDGLGFINSAAGNVTVSTGLNLKDVTCALGEYTAASSTTNKKFIVNSIGALVGKATGAVALTNVAVTLKGTEFGYSVTNKAHDIGGIVGAAANTITIKGSTVTGASTKIHGSYNLGGIVGGESANDKAIIIGTSAAGVAASNAEKCTVSLGGFITDRTNSKTVDKFMARIGGFIGSAGTLTEAVNYYNGQLTATVDLWGTVTIAEGGWPTTQMQTNQITEGSAAEGYDYLPYVKNNDFIGYCGDIITTIGNIYINGNTNKKTTPLKKPAEGQTNALYWFEAAN